MYLNFCKGERQDLNWFSMLARKLNKKQHMNSNETLLSPRCPVMSVFLLLKNVKPMHI